MEKLNQKVAPLSTFYRRVARYSLFAFSLIVFSVGIGIIGYRYYGHLGWVDSFHMASMILTGMGPVVVLNDSAAKIFSSLYALYSGVAFLSITGVFFAPIIHRVLHLLQVDDSE